MLKAFKYIGLILLALATWVILRTLYASGTFKKITPIEIQPFKVIDGIVGAEDLTIDYTINKAMISADDRRKHMMGEDGKGAIYLFNYKNTPPTYFNLTEGVHLPDFHPHGMSLFHDKTDDSKWLFVINHRQKGHTIEIFQFNDSTLIHMESIMDEAFLSPNDVVGTGKRTFYFTNDHDTPGGTDRWKDYLLIGTGQMGFYDGQKATILATGIGYANGINMTKDGRHLLVAATTERCILVYNRQTHERIAKVKCKTGVDNIELDDTGNLWLGCHPKMLAFVKHSQEEENRSPSQILKIELNPNNFAKSKLTEIYLNRGDPLSGSSVAAYHNNVLLMGTVFENGIGMSLIN
jgi:arylesterase/paraoxonase